MSLTVEPGTSHDSLDGSPQLAARLRALATAAQPPYRYDMADAPYGWSSVGPILELPTANGCDPMAPERVVQLRLSFAPGERWGTCYQVVNAASPVVGLANVRYVLSKSPLPLPAAGQIVGYTIYENPRVLPRFFFTPAVQSAADLPSAARLLHAADFDPARTADCRSRAPRRTLLQRRYPARILHAQSNPPAHPHSRRRLPDRCRLLVSRLARDNRRASLTPLHRRRRLPRNPCPGRRSRSGTALLPVDPLLFGTHLSRRLSTRHLHPQDLREVIMSGTL